MTATSRLGLVVALAAALAACGGESSTAPVPLAPSAAGTVAPPPGQPCPVAGAPPTSGHTSVFGAIELPCLRPGPPIQLDTLGGRRPVMVNLWASWCLPCQREMPRLQSAAARAGTRLLVLGIDTEDTVGSARSFLRAVHVTYPQVVDRDGRVRIQLHAVGLPDTVVISAGGVVVFRKLGELSAADVRQALGAVGIHG